MSVRVAEWVGGLREPVRVGGKDKKLSIQCPKNVGCNCEHGHKIPSPAMIHGTPVKIQIPLQGYITVIRKTDEGYVRRRPRWLIF